MSVIQIRGTSGSGKSTAMRAVKEALGGLFPIYQTGRKQPLYYGKGWLIILGHYESACGGCDTIGSAAQVYALIEKLLSVDPTRTILCEGLLLSEDVKHSSKLPDLRVLFLTTGVEDCIERIKGRRAEAGNDKPLKEDNTRNRVAVIERARKKLVELGVECRRCSSEQAPKIILNWLGIECKANKSG